MHKLWITYISKYLCIVMCIYVENENITSPFSSLYEFENCNLN